MCTHCKDIGRYLERERTMQVNTGREAREREGEGKGWIWQETKVRYLR